MAAPLLITAAMDHEGLWAPWFRASSWGPWRAFLKALFNIPMTEAELELFRECTARAEAPSGVGSAAWLICGRRAGKSMILALIACYFAVFRDWRPYLSPGEIGTIKIIANDRRQARVIHRYCRALLTEVSALKEHVTRETEEELLLSTGISIEVQTASYRNVRGYTIVAALCDEIAFWRDESSANPDVEILAALQPAMATVPGAMLLCASSPHARRGALWNAYRRYYGKDGGPLVWQADTRTMNPTVPQHIIDEAYEADPARAAAEFGAQFRVDVESYISQEVIDAVTVPGRYELPPIAGVHYFAFCDAAGGSGSDSMTLAIAHADRATARADGGPTIILDAVREYRPPFTPTAVVQAFAGLLREFKVTEIRGDRYSGDWVASAFRTNGIRYIPSDKSASEIYNEFLPVLTSKRAELLDDRRLLSQLAGLERRTRAGGKDLIAHAPGSHHDDLINSAAGAIVFANAKRGPLVVTDTMLHRARQKTPVRTFGPFTNHYRSY